jgi:flagellar biosynthesis protein FliR
MWKFQDDGLTMPVYSRKRVFFVAKVLLWLLMTVCVFVPVALISYRVLSPEAGMALLLTESIVGCGLALLVVSGLEFLVVALLASAAVVCGLQQIATIGN